VFENELIVRISGPTREGVRGGQGKLLNEELNRVMTSRRMKEVGYAACTEEIENTCKLKCRKLEEKKSLVQLDSSLWSIYLFSYFYMKK
jgi:hypothetical protein